MGSTTSGRFNDYPSPKPKGVGGGGGDGGPDDGDRCGKALSTALEEVERCQYFHDYGAVPTPGTKVILEVGKRLSVKAEGGVTIGFLPTQYNYLAICVSAGYEYRGVVVSSSSPPLSRVVVDLAPA